MREPILFATLAGLTLLAGNALAEQSGSGHYGSGMFTDFSATVPTQTGWVFGNYYLNYNDGTFGSSKQMPFGRIVGAGITANESVNAVLGMYAYPVDFLGGTLASGVALPYVWLRVKANVIVGPHTGNVEQSTSGLGDIQMIPIMAGWTNGDFKYDFYMNIWAPTGDYSKTDLANVGLGYWTFTPMVAVSWLSSKIGTEVSVFTGVDFNTENTDANYQSGDIFHVDATVAQHLPLFGGIAGAGASAFYLKQFTGDSGSGATLGAFEVESYGVGPTISYIHKVGKSDLIVDASWLPQLHTENTTKGNFFWAKVTLVF